MALLESNCPNLKLISRGKVRDLYEIDEESLLIVATDRISAFDGIKNKGKILTELSLFWFNFLNNTSKNHILISDFEQMPSKVKEYRNQLEGRSILVKKLSIFPFEAIVRGSGWKEYLKDGALCGIKLPIDLQSNQKLEAPLFTPSTKAEIGDHVANSIGIDNACSIKKLALDIYQKCSEFSFSKGIIIADTKFEFGYDEQGIIYLADEVLTPDSSRFWSLNDYTPGSDQKRDYLISINFNPSKDVGIELPDYVIQNTYDKYLTAFELITGRKFIE